MPSRWQIFPFLIGIVCLMVVCDSTEPHNQRRLLLQLLDSSRITVSNERLPVIDKYCTTENQSPVTVQESALAEQRMVGLKRFFKFDNNFIRAVWKHDRNKAIEYFDQGFTLYMLPVAIGLFGSLLLWCCMSVCLFGPQYRPSMCDGLRSEPGSACSIKWSAILLLIFLTITMLAGVFALYSNNKIRRDTKESQCRLSQVLNTVAYGGITQDHSSYFVGVRTVKGLLDDTIFQVKGTLDNLTRDLKTSQQQVESYSRRVRDDLEFVADKNTPNGTFQLTYINPTPVTPQLESKFGGVLGSPSHSFSLLGGLYLLMKTTNVGASIMDKIQQFIIRTIRPNVDSQIERFGSKLDRESQSLDKATKKFDQVMQKTDHYRTLGYGLMMVLFGLVIVVCLFAIIASIGYIFMKIPSWRCFMIGCFIVLGILCILSFVASVITALSIPAIYAGCQPFKTALTNPNQFRSTAIQFGLDQKKATQVSKCFGDGNAQFLSPTLRSNIMKKLDLANKLMDVSNVVTTTDMGFLSAAARKVHEIIKDYYTAGRNDILYDGSTAQWFGRLADHSEVQSVCRDNEKFSRDTLLPSISQHATNCPQQNVVDCRNFTHCNTGCIDLTATMMNYKTSEQWVNDIRSRYTGDCGVVVSALLGVLYRNWHVPRIDPDRGIGGVKARFEAGPMATIGLIDETIKNFQSTVHSNVEKLKTSAERVTDPQYGVIAIGTNCRVIGQRAITARNSVCVRTFNTAYLLAIVSAAVAFGLLFSLCALTCSIIKYEQDEGLDKSRGDGGDNGPCCLCCDPGQPDRSSYDQRPPNWQMGRSGNQPQIQRINSGITHYSIPSTAMNSRLYPLPNNRESIGLDNRRSGGMSFLSNRFNNRNRNSQG